jgi:hypothetical protein
MGPSGPQRVNRDRIAMPALGPLVPQFQTLRCTIANVERGQSRPSRVSSPRANLRIVRKHQKANENLSWLGFIAKPSGDIWK